MHSKSRYPRHLSKTAKNAYDTQVLILAPVVDTDLQEQA